MNTKIIDVKVSTQEHPGSYVDDEHFCELSEIEKFASMQWATRSFVEAKSVNEWHTSYGLKHILENDIGIYMTNNQFKELMLLSGFAPARIDELNWSFYIANTSPAFKKQNPKRIQFINNLKKYINREENNDTLEATD